MNRFATFLLLLVGLRSLAAQAQTTRYVSTTGTQPASGATSWANSTTDLQGAINLSNPGDVVWVRSGVYKPGGNTNTTRTISFSMKNGVAIYGGFFGIETNLSQRPPINPVTGNPSGSTLSGDIDNDGTLANNSIHVIDNPAGLTTTAVLDGFVITGGNANGFSPGNAGGGVNNGSSGAGQVCSPSFRSCSFVGNSAIFGGAMFNNGSSQGESSPVLTNCVLQSNSAAQGGVMGNFALSGVSRPVLTNCLVVGNSASFFGGVIYNFGYDGGVSSPVLINCTLQGNSASQAGGTMYNLGVSGVSSPMLANCVLWGNGGNSFVNDNAAGASATYSLFDITANVNITGPGNLTTATSPFASATTVALAAGSPAINAGNPASATVASGPYSATALPATDLAGNPRVFGCRVDMGAVENQSVVFSPPRLYVAASQTANVGDGQSWGTAFPDLQSALTYPCSQNLTEIWVAAGTYKPTAMTGPDSRTISFAMLPGVAIYGGFRGTESSLSERPAVNPVAAEGRPGSPSSSTLSGDIDNDGTLANNSYHVINNPASLSLTNTAVLDGFVITGGNANGSNNNSLGGGVFNGGSRSVCNPSFRNCMLQGNSATDRGGAMYNDGFTNGVSSPVLTNCTLQGNSASYGGAMHNQGFNNGVSSPVLTNCTLQSNTATNNGGALYNSGFSNGVSSPVLTNCTLQSNIATGQVGQGGAIFNLGNSGQSSPVLTNCTLQKNTATDRGGAIYNSGFDNGVSSPTLTNCRLQVNSATSGGAIYNSGNNGVSNPALINCTLQGNSASNQGGAMFNDGSQGQSKPVLTNCVLQGNSASNQGGVMYNQGFLGQSSPVLINCSLQGNMAPGGGGAIYSQGFLGQSSSMLTNTVLWNNGGNTSFSNNNGATTQLRYSLFDNSVTGYISGPGNLATATSPFVSATSVALLPCSPAINAGDLNTTTVTVGTTDLAGNPRFFGGRIDMGAVEYQAAPIAPPRLYVSASQTANVGDGQSWATAFPDLQSALTYPCSQSLTEIWVAAGTYKPASGSSFAMLPGVAIYGGFEGGERDLSQRPPVNPVLGNPSNTTLAGNGSRVVTNPSGLTTTAVLDGFVITGGGNVDQGGGMYNNGSSPTLRNCLFVSNQAMGGGLISTFGGAMYNLGSNPVLTNCSFEGNQATGSGTTINKGGAMYNENSRPVLTNCSFEGNQATGMYSVNNGGAMYNLDSNPVLTNCLFEGNQATGGRSNNGGAMYTISSSGSIGTPALADRTGPSLINCLFVGNQATGGFDSNGGAMYNSDSSPGLTNCSFQDNQATGSGGAIYNLGSHPMLTNCSFQGNQVTGSSNNNLGGAIYNNGSNPVLTSTVVWNNGGENTFYNAGRALTARYSLFDNSVTGYVSDPTNLTAATSPFVSETSTQLNSCALAIGSADPATTSLTVGTTDLAGNARFTNGRLDMGAYQYQGVVSDQVRSITLQPIAGTAVCAGTSVAVPVSATGLGTSFSYQWYKGSAVLSSQTSATLTLPAATTADAGTYRVVVSTACNSVTSTAFSLTVNAPPTATLSASNNGTLTCAQTSLTLTAGGGNAYAFAGPGVVSQNATAGTAVVNASGTYSVTVTHAATGCFSTTTTEVYSNTSAPTVNISPTSATLSCAVTSVTLTASGSAANYRWTGGSSGNTLVVSTPGTYAVTATSANSCTAVSTNVVVSQDIAPPTGLQLSAGPSSTLTCAQTSLTLTASSSSTGVTFRFVGPAGSNLAGNAGSANAAPAGSSATQLINAPGTYTVIATGANGCTATATTTIENNTVAPANVSLTPTPSSTLSCAQTSVTLTASATGTGLGYAFTGPAGSVPGSGNTRTISAPGTYTVVVSGTNGCTATSTTAISQNTVPPLPSLTTSTGSLTFCANSSLTLVAGGGVSYSFSSGATQLGGSPDNTATMSTAGTYSVVVSGANGCTATASVSVSTVAVTTLTSVPPASVSVCETGAVSLSVVASGVNLRYQWYKNSSPLNGQTMPTLSIPSAGSADNGSYYVTVTGVCGTTATNPTTLTVRPRPAAPSLATSSVTAVVSTTPLPLTPFIVATGNTLSFSGVNGLLTPPVADISTAGVQNFSVTATDAFGCVSLSTPFSLTVYLPFPPASQNVCRGSAVVLSVLPTAVRYQWYRVNGTALLRLTDVAGVQRGTGTASLTLLSVQTSASYVCQGTLANGSVVSYGPYAIGVTICGGREAATEPTLSLSVVVAPNPLVGEWLRATVSGASGQRLRVSLLDQRGYVLVEQQWEHAAEGQSIEWNVSQTPAGTLLLQAATDRHSYTVKVLKQ